MRIVKKYETEPTSSLFSARVTVATASLGFLVGTAVGKSDRGFLANWSSSFWHFWLPSLRRGRSFLFEAVHQIEIGEGAMITVDAGSGVGGEENWPDGYHAGGIRRHQLSPEGALARPQIDEKDACRQFAGLVDIQAAIASESDRLFAGQKARDWLWCASLQGVQIAFLVGADGGHEL